MTELGGYREATNEEYLGTYDTDENPRENVEFQGIPVYSDDDIKRASAAVTQQYREAHLSLDRIEAKVKRLRQEQSDQQFFDLSLEHTADSHWNISDRIAASEQFISYLLNILIRGNYYVDMGQSLHETMLEQYTLARANTQRYGALLSNDEELLFRYTSGPQPAHLVVFTRFADSDYWRYLLAREAWTSLYDFGVRLAAARSNLKRILAEVKQAWILEQKELDKLKESRLNPKPEPEPEPQPKPHSRHDELK